MELTPIRPSKEIGSGAYVPEPPMAAVIEDRRYDRVLYQPIEIFLKNKIQFYYNMYETVYITKDDIRRWNLGDVELSQMVQQIELHMAKTWPGQTYRTSIIAQTTCPCEPAEDQIEIKLDKYVRQQ